MTTHDYLTGPHLWRDDGHLAEPALHAIADAELELLPQPALAHLDACEHCTARVGEIALLACEIANVIVPAPQPSAARPALPWLAIASAFALALVSNLPWLSTLTRGHVIGETLSAARVLILLTLRLFGRLVTSSYGGGLLWFSALCLIATSLFVARGSRPLDATHTGGTL